LPWYGLYAFRGGLATNLHELGVTIAIQTILRDSDASVIRQAYINADPRSLAAMEALESAVCNPWATESADTETEGAIN
jgi:hypothetical protein